MLINIKDKPVQVISIKAETSNNECLCWGYNVEITLKRSHAKELYIYLNQYLNSHYTVSDRSMFDFVTDRADEVEQVDFIEDTIKRHFHNAYVFLISGLSFTSILDKIKTDYLPVS